MFFDFIRPAEIKIDSASIAIVPDGKKITYGELSNFVKNLSAFLVGQGINKNDAVTLLFENSPEFIITVLALWEIGAIPVPLNIKLLEKDLDEQIKFLKPRITIKSKGLENKTITGRNIAIPFDDLPGNKDEKPQPDFSMDRIALILFTSGSSGKPKAVTLSFNNLVQSALIGNAVLNHTNEERWLTSLPFYHIGGFSIIVRAIMFGASIIIPDSLSNEDLKKSMNKHHPTLASLVSNQLKKFIDEDFIPLQKLRTVLLGGGFFEKELILKAIGKGWKIAKVYGSTETSSFVSFMNSDEVKQKPKASGKVIPPNKIIITDEGEIAVQSPAVMKYYFNNDEETFNKLKEGFYYTGDIGYLDKEGYLFVEAKRSDLIISGGENINPVEVEKEILHHTDVKKVCVVGVEEEKWGQVVSAAIVLKKGSTLSGEKLKKFLNGKLAAFKIPKQMVFVKQLPESPLGKIERAKVQQLLKNLL